RVVAEHPAVEGLVVAVAREREVDDAVRKQAARSLVLKQGVERKGAPGRAVSGPGHARLNDDGTAQLLGTGPQVESMKPLHVAGLAAADFHGRRDDVVLSVPPIDYRRPSKAVFVRDVAGLACSGCGDSCDTRGRIGEVHMPQRGTAPAVGVEGVDTVVLS